MLCNGFPHPKKVHQPNLFYLFENRKQKHHQLLSNLFSQCVQSFFENCIIRNWKIVFRKQEKCHSYFNEREESKEFFHFRDTKTGKTEKKDCVVWILTESKNTKTIVVTIKSFRCARGNRFSTPYLISTISKHFFLSKKLELDIYNTCSYFCLFLHKENEENYMGTKVSGDIESQTESV